MLNVKYESQECAGMKSNRKATDVSRAEEFTAAHDGEFIRGKKRLYVTAPPRKI